MKFYKNRKVTDYQVGFFTLLALLIVIFSYFWLMDYLQHRNYTLIKVAFPNANNCEVGSAVTINGVRKGSVKDIEIMSDRVIFLLKVEFDFPLSEDSRFYVLESTLMGDTRVEIIPGKSALALDPTAIQQGSLRVGLTRLVSDLGDLMAGLQTTMDRFDLNRIDNFFVMMDSITTLVANFNRLYDNSSPKIDKLLSEATVTVNNLNSILSENEDESARIIDNTSLLISEMTQITRDIGSIMVNLGQFSEKINQDTGTLGRLISDEKLYLQILKTTSHLDSLLVDIQKNPQKYFKVRVF
jgi:phospholipid/cholesterol/gamma-HCH transport system substrate-binding protein